MTGWDWLVNVTSGAVGGLGVAIVVRKRKELAAVRRARRTEPQPPRNVRVVKADGTVIPVECVYRGQDEDGVHIWRSVHPVNFVPWVGDVLRIDELPGRTAVEIRPVS